MCSFLDCDAEIQFNISPLFDVLGREGYALHRELIEIQRAFDQKGKLSDTDSSFNMDDLLAEAVGCSSTSARSNSLFESLSSVPDVNSGVEKYDGKGGMTPTLSSIQRHANGETPQLQNRLPVESEEDRILRPNFDEREVNPLTEPSMISPAPMNNESVAGLTPDGQVDPTGDGATTFDPIGTSPAPTLPVPIIASAGDQLSAATKRHTSEGVDGSSFPETRKMLLDGLRDQVGFLSGGDIFLSILEHGSRAASLNSRDVATFYCLYVLFTYVVKRERDEKMPCLGFGVQGTADVIEYSQQCLLRCLQISNQAISTGMTGWLEYGSSSTLDRLTERPFIVLRHLAYNFGRQNQWEDAECVCLAFIVRCEQYLPLYHPTTLTSLIDLAICSYMMKKTASAERTISRVAERLSRYLAEMEKDYMSLFSKGKPSGKAGDTVFRIEHGRDATFMLHAFVSLFQSHLGRDIATLVGSDNEIVLTNHYFVADSLAVYANCIGAAKSVLGSVSGSTDGYRSQYWQYAFAHYQRAFNGFSNTKGLDDPSVSRAAYGLARCLREFGETEKAFQLLSMIISYSERTMAESGAKKSVADFECETKIAEETNGATTASLTFLPHLLNTKNAFRDRTRASQHTSSALCLWLMAILALDQSPNEEGRERAFSYLHAASVSLQSAMNMIADVDDEATKAMCIRFLAMIEDEAGQISEPIYE